VKWNVLWINLNATADTLPVCLLTYFLTCIWWWMADTPEAPRSLEMAEVSRAGIVLQWDAPRHDGGSPVTGYVLERAQAYSNRWLRLAHLLSARETTYRDVNVHDGYVFTFITHCPPKRRQYCFSSSSSSSFNSQPMSVKNYKRIRLVALVAADATGATRGLYLALSKAWRSCSYIRPRSISHSMNLSPAVML